MSGAPDLAALEPSTVEEPELAGAGEQVLA